MSNGCICCTLREDLMVEVKRLADEGRFDYLLIESTRVSEPMPVAETFFFRDESGNSLEDIARLDTMVTVVDAFNFRRDYKSPDRLPDRKLEVEGGDHRSIVNLLIDQVEFADLIVLNKIDLVNEDEKAEVIAMIKGLNSKARIVECSNGAVKLPEILDTKMFNYDEASQTPDWLKAIYEEPMPETKEYGISTFVYKARRPFHPQRLHEFLGKQWPGVVRRRGSFGWQRAWSIAVSYLWREPKWKRSRQVNGLRLFRKSVGRVTQNLWILRDVVGRVLTAIDGKKL